MTHITEITDVAEARAVSPELDELMQEARALDPSEQWRYSRRLKVRLRRLVGWHADHPELRSCELYEAACRALVEELASAPHDDGGTTDGA